MARLSGWAGSLAVVVLVFVCYWPALDGALLWDDPAHITRPHLRSWDGLVRIWTDVRATQQYYPVLHTAFWLEHRLVGDAPRAYHVINVLQHALASCLLAVFLRRLWSGTAVPTVAAWGAALLFAVHPVCVESVAWITEQKNTLSLVLYLLAALAYDRFVSSRRPIWYAAASLVFLLALGTKTVTATLPAALLVIQWWRQGGLGWRRDVAPLVPWFAVGLGSGLVTVWVERTLIGAEGAAFDLTFVQRLLLAARVTWFYLAKLAWPADLAFFYPRWDVAAQAGAWWGFLLAASAVTVALAWWRRRSRGPLAAWLLYGGSLFPALGFFNVYPFLFSYVADHFQYLAAASLISALVGGAAWARARYLPRASGAGVLAVILAVAVLGVTARSQASLYRSNETLFRENIAKVPDSWMAHHILAHTLSKTPGREVEAVRHYREALRHNPEFPDAHLGLGVVLAASPATVAEAIPHYERAIALRPHYAEAHNNLGYVLSTQPGRQADAERHLREAARLNPGFLPPRLTLARLLARQPTRRAEAIDAFREVVRVEPASAEAHHALGVLFMQTPGRREEALPYFEAAVRLEPDNVVALNSLGLASAELGRFDRARECWQRALALDPRSEEARRNLQRLEQMQPR